MTYEEAIRTILPGRYRHFKGNEYEVIGISQHSETEEPMVVYRALYGDGGLWCRPASMWLEEVVRDGKKYQRFEKIVREQAAIETERLRLRQFTVSDAADVYEYLHKPEQNCFKDMQLKSLEDTEQELRKRRNDPLYLAVELKESGKVIGELFAAPEGTDPSAEDMDTYSPCWMLHPDYKRKGYGYEAVHAYIDYLFRHENARRVYMYTEDTNIACQKLCEKLGARKEGLFVEFVSFVKDEQGNPAYENTLQYAILRKEWLHDS